MEREQQSIPMEKTIKGSMQMGYILFEVVTARKGKIYL
jgi:hypothetical protein